MITFAIWVEMTSNLVTTLGNSGDILPCSKHLYHLMIWENWQETCLHTFVPLNKNLKWNELDKFQYLFL